MLQYPKKGVSSMIQSALVSYLAPKVIKYLFSTLGDWGTPIAKGVGCSVINFGSEKYQQNREHVATWVRQIVPGEKFDDIAVKAVDGIIVFAMSQIAQFVECDIAGHQLSLSDSRQKEVFAKAALAAGIPAVVEKLSNAVVSNALAALNAGEAVSDAR